VAIKIAFGTIIKVFLYKISTVSGQNFLFVEMKLIIDEFKISQKSQISLKYLQKSK
jgi:hypothetical protein